MRQPSLLRRYILFFCGVLCAALGIALITLAGMGTSAVSSLSYVLTFVFPGLSLGVFTFLVNCTMLVGQVLLLRHRFQSIQLLQIPATLLFSVCIDLWTELLAPLVPESYGARWVVLLLGCLSLGLGVALEVLPNVLILPCEGFVRTASQVFGWDFGKTKTGYDLAMVSAAALLSYLSLGGHLRPAGGDNSLCPDCGRNLPIPVPQALLPAISKPESSAHTRRSKRRPYRRRALKAQVKCRPYGRHFKKSGEKLALGELGSAAGGFQAVLKFFDCRFSLIF